MTSNQQSACTLAASKKRGPFIAAVIILAGFVILCRSIYDFYPPVWPDEAIVADSAVYLLKTGHLGSVTFAGLYPGIDTHWFGYPPGYAWMLAGVLRFADPTLSVCRGFSMVWGVAALIAFALCVRSASGSCWLAVGALAALAVDPSFVRAANSVRMDMASVASGLWAAWCYLRYRGRPSAWAAFAAGALAGLALLIHWIGGFIIAAIGLHLIITERHRLFTRPGFWLTVGGVVIVLMPWIVSILSAHDVFRAQFAEAIGRKTSAPEFDTLVSSLRRAFEVYGPLVPIQYFFGLMLLALGWFTYRRRHWATWGFILLTAAIETAGCIELREMSYTVYFTPYLQLCTWLVLYELWRTQKARWFGAVVGGALAAVLIVSLIFGLTSRRFPADLDRHQIAEAVVERCPAGSHILLSCIPDPWFDLHNAGREYVLHEFVPRGHTPEKEYRLVLERLDFIVNDSPWGMEQAHLYKEFVRRRTLEVSVIPAGGGSFQLYDVRKMDRDQMQTGTDEQR